MFLYRAEYFSRTHVGKFLGIRSRRPCSIDTCIACSTSTSSLAGMYWKNISPPSPFTVKKSLFSCCTFKASYHYSNRCSHGNPIRPHFSINQICNQLFTMIICQKFVVFRGNPPTLHPLHYKNVLSCSAHLVACSAAISTESEGC
jgi:hypothetical protein